MIDSDILVIGGGASGLMAAIRAAEKGCRVTLCEKNEKCGRKILITGKGRCNITNTREWNEFSKHIHPNSQFFKSAFFNFSNIETIEFFKKIGLETVVERGDRVFPKSMKSIDVANSMIRYAESLNVDIRVGREVIKLIRRDDGRYVSTSLTSAGVSMSEKIGVEMITANCVIVATGGLSYPVTGSTGDGYQLAKSLGHTINKTFPSLTVLRPVNYSSLYSGTLLKNVEVRLVVSGDVVQREFGELQFTEDGIEGALGFRVSRRAVIALNNGNSVELIIDLKPAILQDELTRRVSRDINDFSEKKEGKGQITGTKKEMKLLLRRYLPDSIIMAFISSNKDLSLLNLPYKLKNWSFKIASHGGYSRAVITMGGVPLEEISRKSFESKLSAGLFFAGEIVDLDGDTGGYNLQIAFSTGVMAADSAVRANLKISE